MMVSRGYPVFGQSSLAACEGLDLVGSQKAPAQPLWGLGTPGPTKFLSFENPDWIVRIPFSSSINPIQLHTAKYIFYASASFIRLIIRALLL